jgi:hypothetical protein
MKSVSPLPNLHRFAAVPDPEPPVESDPLTICGDILRAARVEIERAALISSGSSPGSETHLEALLGVISYCYCKGVIRSCEIEEHLVRNAAFRIAFGENLPTAQTIRSFRRRHRDVILATIERALQYFWGHCPEPPPHPETSCSRSRDLELSSSARLRARQIFEAAMFMDRVEFE